MNTDSQGWQARGQIFDVADWTEHPCMGNFAQSPQAIVLDDRVRIFFTTRFPSEDGAAWKSQPMFVDFSLAMDQRLSEPTQVQLPDAKLGCFDEDGIFPFSPVLFDGVIYAFTTGWSRRLSVSVETGIGIATSADLGKSFTRLGDGPVLSANLDEPFLVCDGFVRRVGTAWMMWYCFGTGWTYDPMSKEWERTYKITQTQSENILEWSPAGGRQVVDSVGGEMEAQALPSVLQLPSGELWMSFCYRETFNFRTVPSAGYKIGFASSFDGQSWERWDGSVSVPRAGFDSKMQCYPHIFLVEGTAHLLYNGDEFGKHGFGLASWRS